MARHAQLRLAGVLAVAASLAATPCPALAGDVAVRLSLSQQFYYVGDALDVQITVHNRGQKSVENPIKTALLDGFHVRRDGQILSRSGKPGSEEPTRPEKIAAGSFYGGVFELTEHYPELRGAGTFEIHWSADQVVSDMIVVTTIPRFDPMQEYTAEIQTELGAITLELYANESPIAVKSFVDLAHAGFYDGLQISEVHADAYIVGGDPRFSDRPRPSIEFPAETSAAPLVAGTVVLRPVRAAPPGNGPTFVILLRPQPAWTGQVTVLGQVTAGLDVVQRLARLPSSMRNSQPNFKPLRETRIERLTVRPKPAVPPAS